MKNTKAQLESAIMEALNPGLFVDSLSIPQFVAELVGVKERISALTTEGHAVTAAELFDYFIGACHAKSEELEDSAAEFGRFVMNLFGHWTVARLVAGMDQDETVRALFRWIDNDDYGYFCDLQTNILQFLDAEGRQALEREITRRSDAEAKPDGHGDV